MVEVLKGVISFFYFFFQFSQALHGNLRLTLAHQNVFGLFTLYCLGAVTLLLSRRPQVDGTLSSVILVESGSRDALALDSSWHCSILASPGIKIL